MIISKLNEILMSYQELIGVFYIYKKQIKNGSNKIRQHP